MSLLCSKLPSGSTPCFTQDGIRVPVMASEPLPDAPATRHWPVPPALPSVPRSCSGHQPGAFGVSSSIQNILPWYVCRAQLLTSFKSVLVTFSNHTLTPQLLHITFPHTVDITHLSHLSLLILLLKCKLHRHCDFYLSFSLMNFSTEDPP